MTAGSYRIARALFYPDHMESLVVFDAQVVPTSDSEWTTEIAVHGTYTGPTDIVASNDYRLTWAAHGTRLLESGSALLTGSSGERVRQVWGSIITPEGTPEPATSDRFKGFSASGQTIDATISPFKIDGQHMSYEWTGTVAVGPGSESKRTE